MEQHYQNIDQKLQHNNDLEYFAAHFVQQFTTKTSPKQYFTINSFEIISRVNPIDLVKTRV